MSDIHEHVAASRIEMGYDQGNDPETRGHGGQHKGRWMGTFYEWPVHPEADR